MKLNLNENIKRKLKRNKQINRHKLLVKKLSDNCQKMLKHKEYDSIESDYISMLFPIMKSAFREINSR